MTETWYLLYDGQSCDGRGTATYKGRTTSEKDARKHFNSIQSFYDIGYVEIVTDDTKTRMAK